MSSTKLQVIPKQMVANGQRVAVESDTTLVPARSLDALAGTIRHEHDLVTKAAERMLEHAVLCGDALREAKSRVKRGEWVAWIDQNCSFKRPTANFYMRVSFYVDLLRENGVDSLGAARGFLLDHDLVLGNTNALTEEQVEQIHALARQGMSRAKIANAVGCAVDTVAKYLREPSRGSNPKYKGPRLGRRKSGRRKRSSTVITDDLVEGAAIKLRELFSSDSGDVTDTDRDAAVEILRAAFTYDGPVPGDGA